MAKPFEAVRVLDLTHVLAGPFCTFQLSCMGADVIKIESLLAPDMTRMEGVDEVQNKALYGSYFQSQNAGKRGITINLKSTQGCDVLWRLIETADVLVQNYAGDALEDLGFGYEAVSQVNPSIIYCSISGFGRTGPKADHPAYDVVIQAFSGIMAANGEAGSEPVRVGPPMVDYGTGAQAAFAIAAALFQRQNTGLGQYIDVSMLDAALMLSSASVVDTLLTGDKPEAHGNTHPSYAGYATYHTADGQIMIGAWTNKQLSSLFKVLGEHERAAQVSETERENIGDTQAADARTIAQHMLNKTAAQWEALCNRAHVPAAKVRSLDETLQEEQLQHRGVLQKLSNTGDGNPDLFPVAAFSYARGSPSVESPPPKLGEHTHEVLLESGFTEAQIKQLLDEGAI